MIYNNIAEIIGKTPLLYAKKFSDKFGATANIFAKLEYFNPSGSIKDRAALNMLEDAFEKGIINRDSVIIEPTSGNTGIGIAMLGAYYGMRTILTMPDTMSIERRKMLMAYGAEIVLTPGDLGMKGSVDKANELKSEIPGAFIPSQFDNPANCKAHIKSTGPEIWEDLNGKVDVLVATFGTGGTITGLAKFLKEKNNRIVVIGVEPSDSPLVSKGVAGPHKLQGIGANFVPSILDTSLIDRIETAATEESYKAAQDFSKTEGAFVGISSGAALSVALRVSDDYKGKNIVVILPDSGSRYISTEGFIK